MALDTSSPMMGQQILKKWALKPSGLGDFIPGRSITDNILLANDLVRGFHLDKGPARMCLKLDLSRAFDSVRWKFLEVAMEHLNFPRKMINWILECVRNPAFSVIVNDFSVIVNDKPCGFFNSNQALRQACPLSPTLLQRHGVLLLSR